MKRRDFLKTTAFSTASLAFHNPLLAVDAESPSSNPATVPCREYGKTGINLSIIAFGGLVLRGSEQEHADRAVAEAVERGVNYFDVAPTYGNAEERLGPALEPYRKNVFLACKTRHRDREGAEGELSRSLERLRTDYFDLYQLHAISDVEKDVKTAFAKGGAMEAILEAKKDGRVRHVGFSAHSVESALAAMDLHDFDSLLFPINFACYYKGHFGSQVVKKAQATGTALIGLKTLVRQKWPKDHPARKDYPKCWYQPLYDPEEADLGLRWTLSQPVTAAIPPGDESLFWLGLDLGMKFKPMTPEENQKVKDLAAEMNPLFAAG
jgi:predicted aldo/keto reductase-like oxidoreductase